MPLDAQDQTRPTPEFDPGIRDVDLGNTFADMPQGDPPPSMLARDDDEPIGEDVDDAPAPAAPVAPGPPELDQKIYSALEQFGARQRQEQAALAQSQAAAREIARSFEPPVIDNAEEILSDPEKFKAHELQRAEWTRNAIVKAVGPLAQALEQQTAANRQVLEQAHAGAWDAARTTLNEEGIDADKYYGNVEMVLRANPQNYTQFRINPNALIEAVRMVHRNSGSAFTGPVQTGPAPASAGSGRQTTRGAEREVTGSRQDRAALAHAEQALGRKFSPATRKAFYQNMQGGR